MTWDNVAITIAFLVAVVGFWAMLVAIAVWNEWKDDDE
jgi:hypothetical protein